MNKRKLSKRKQSGRKKLLALCMSAVFALSMNSASAFAAGNRAGGYDGSVVEASDEGAALLTAGTILDQGMDGNISWRIEGSDVYEHVMCFDGNGPMEDYIYDCGDAPWARSPWLYLVKRIEIGKGITYIGNNTFNFIGSVRLMPVSLYIADTVTAIGRSAFMTMELLHEVDIPGSVRSIGDSAFYWCRQMSRLTLNEGLETIGRSAFENCQRIPAPVIPSTVHTIGEKAFYDCEFTRAVIPPTVKKIGEKAFGYGSYGPISGFTIQGEAGSAAEAYARANGFLFTTSSEPIPVPVVKASNENLNTVKISWEQIKGAAAYEVCYKKGSSSSVPWTKIAAVSGTSYTWKNAEVSTAYSFTVRAVDAQGNPISKYAKAVSLSTYFPVPEIKVEKASGGIRISWTEPYSAYKYRIYYKTGSSGWKELTSVSGNSYFWGNAKGGTTYYFTVRRLDSGGNFTSPMDNTGRKITASYRYTAPRLTKVENLNGGIKITWGKVTGAKKYRVLYKTGSGSWKKLADTASGSYTWKNPKNNTKYTFTVRCISNSGEYESSYDSKGKSITYLSAPQLSKVENVNGGVKISWKKVTGAEKYRILYKTGSGSWKKLKDTTLTSFTWKNAKSGTTYAFTIRCLNKKSTAYTSSYNTTGKKILYLAVPQLLSAKKSGSGIKVSWKKVTGADRYRVSRKTAGGKWAKIAVTSSVSYTDKTARKGVVYYYTVRSMKGSTTSSYTVKGISGKR